MDTQGAIKWVKTSGLAVLGGGISGTVAGMMDPTKYHIPQDLFSGKLWPHFFTGAGLIFGALLLKSPLGQKVSGQFPNLEAVIQQSQMQMKNDQAQQLEALKAQFKPPPKEEK